MTEKTEKVNESQIDYSDASVIELINGLIRKWNRRVA